MRTEARALICNASGLHARPCHALVAVALKYEADLTVDCGGPEVNGKSILSLMTLGAAQGMELRFCADGGDAEALVEELVALVASGFDEAV